MAVTVARDMMARPAMAMTIAVIVSLTKVRLLIKVKSKSNHSKHDCRYSPKGHSTTRCRRAHFLATWTLRFHASLSGYTLGTGLVSVMGTSFTFLPIAREVVVSEIQAGRSGMDAYGKFLGTCLAASLTEIFISFVPPRYLKKIFPPVVSGTCVILIGAGLSVAGLKTLASKVSVSGSQHVFGRLMSSSAQVLGWWCVLRGERHVPCCSVRCTTGFLGWVEGRPVLGCNSVFNAPGRARHALATVTWPLLMVMCITSALD